MFSIFNKSKNQKFYMISYIIRKENDIFSIGEQMFSNINELYFYEKEMKDRGFSIEIVNIVPETTIKLEKIRA